jgi:hypothetical protein
MMVAICCKKKIGSAPVNRCGGSVVIMEKESQFPAPYQDTATNLTSNRLQRCYDPLAVLVVAPNRGSQVPVTVHYSETVTNITSEGLQRGHSPFFWGSESVPPIPIDNTPISLRKREPGVRTSL